MNFTRATSSRLSLVTLLAIATTLSSLCANADDWPRWRGPNLNGISKETGWNANWPKSGPKQLWKRKIGKGYSAPVVADGRLFILGIKGRTETFYCFDAESGEEVWKYDFPTRFKPKYYEGGTSGTATVDGGNVYLLEQTGRLFSFDAKTGKTNWAEDIASKVRSEIGVWGFTGAPLVMGDLLILNVGSHGAAVNKNTGKVAWQSGGGMNGYATPVPFKQNGNQLVAIFSAKALHAVNPETGKEAWSFPWKTQYDVNAADPVLIGNSLIYISSGYGTGGALLQLTGSGVKKVWQNKNLRTQFNPAVFIDGHLYGIDGDTTQRASLNCIDARTGTLKWSQPGVGSGAVIASDGKLIIQSDRGRLVLAEVNSTRFKSIASAQVIGPTCWTSPALAYGRIYTRNDRGDLVALDVKK